MYQAHEESFSRKIFIKVIFLIPWERTLTCRSVYALTYLYKMERELTTYSIKNWVALGRIFFKPPYKVSDSLINEARIVHVVHGQSDLYAASQYSKLQSGETFIMKSDNFVNHWAPNKTEEPNEVIVFQLTSNLLKEIYKQKVPNWFKGKTTNEVPPIQKIPDNFLLNGYFNTLRYYLDTPQFISEELIQIKILELLHILLKTDKKGAISQIFGTLFHPNEYEFQEVIKSHVFDDLTLDELAFLTGLSLSSFKRKFRTIYGTSPKQHMITKRLEKAQVLLKTTDLRITEIAYDCGYSDLGYFTKTFQKHFHCSPSDFREQLLS